MLMAKNTSFSLDERYSEDREPHLHALRNALIDGERSGPSTPFDFDAFIARKQAGEPKAR